MNLVQLEIMPLKECFKAKILATLENYSLGYLYYMLI